MMALQRIVDRLDRVANWKTGVLGLLLLALTQIFLANSVIPNVQALHPDAVSGGMLVMMDNQPLASPDDQYRVIALYKSDILGYVRTLYAIDYVIPFSFMLVFLSLIGTMLRYQRRAGKWRLLLLAPFLTMLCDWTENTTALFLIGEYPARLHGGLARAEGIVTFLKLSGAGLDFALTAVLLILCIVAFVRRRSRALA